MAFMADQSYWRQLEEAVWKTEIQQHDTLSPEPASYFVVASIAATLCPFLASQEHNGTAGADEVVEHL
jgi:hypothetical protein